MMMMMVEGYSSSFLPEMKEKNYARSNRIAMKQLEKKNGYDNQMNCVYNNKVKRKET